MRLIVWKIGEQARWKDLDFKLVPADETQQS